MTAILKRKMTAKEYLEIERRAEHKSEFYNGEMFAMAGASKAHNLIVGNLLRSLGNRLEARNCNVYPSDIRVKIERINKYTYPDVSVTCGEEAHEDDREDVLLNPILIVEILSPSTEAYDRGDKFQHYQFIKSLQEYILIAQDACRVEQYIRQHDWEWTYRVYSSLEDAVKLESINCELPLKEVYLKVPNIVSV